MSRMVLLIVFSFFLTACALYGEKDKKMNSEPGELDLIICEEPRPQVCTREYRPVCATREDESMKTYATGCTSCADPMVKSYKLGACG